MYIYIYVYTYMKLDPRINQQLSTFRVLHRAHLIQRPSTSVPAAMATDACVCKPAKPPSLSRRYHVGGVFGARFCIGGNCDYYLYPSLLPPRPPPGLRSPTAECPLCHKVYAPFPAPAVALDQPVPLGPPVVLTPTFASADALHQAKQLIDTFAAERKHSMMKLPLAAPVALTPPSETVKHSFVHMNLHHDHLNEPLHIDVAVSRMVRVNGGPWHGKAEYGHTGGVGGHWTLLFTCKADLSKLKSTKYMQIPGTKSFLHAKKGDVAYNSMLIPKEYGNTPIVAHRCSPVCGAPLRGS